MIQLLGIIILFVIFTVIFVIFRVLLVARQMIFGKGSPKSNTEFQAPRSDNDEPSVKSKRFDKSKAEDVEFEVIKE